MTDKVRRLSQTQAERNLRRFLAERGDSLSSLKDWHRWPDYPRPMWTVWAVIWRKKTYAHRLVGFHIYDDGEVLLAYIDIGEPDF